MKRILIIILALGFWLLASDTLQAQQRRGVPATPHPIEIVQPNGDTLMIRLRGDERHSWRTTLDGYLIYKNKRGVYCYAKKDKDGKTIATCRVAKNADQRSKCEQRWVEKHIPNTLKQQ